MVARSWILVRRAAPTCCQVSPGYPECRTGLATIESQPGGRHFLSGHYQDDASQRWRWRGPGYRSYPERGQSSQINHQSHLGGSRIGLRPGNLAYIIYTSGEQEHRKVMIDIAVHQMALMNTAYKLNRETTVL